MDGTDHLKLVVWLTQRANAGHNNNELLRITTSSYGRLWWCSNSWRDLLNPDVDTLDDDLQRIIQQKYFYISLLEFLVLNEFFII